MSESSEEGSAAYAEAGEIFMMATSELNLSQVRKDLHSPLTKSSTPNEAQGERNSGLHETAQPLIMTTQRFEEDSWTRLLVEYQKHPFPKSPKPQ